MEDDEIYVCVFCEKRKQLMHLALLPPTQRMSAEEAQS